MEGWKTQERRLAKDVKGTLNAGSGAFARKGDVRAPGLNIEAKWTGKKSKTISAVELEKAAGQAIRAGRIPVFAIELNNRDYAILEWNDFLAMWETYQAANS